MLIKALLIALSMSIMPGTVTNINTLTDCDETIVTVADGNAYGFYNDSGDYTIGDGCILILKNDEVVNAF